MYNSRNTSNSARGITKYYLLFHSGIISGSVLPVDDAILWPEWFCDRCIDVSVIGNGLATPILTIPFGAPFNAWTAWSSDEFSKLISLTKRRRSPGIKRPSNWATPPGTSDRITINVSFGSSGSLTKIYWNSGFRFKKYFSLPDNPKLKIQDHVLLSPIQWLVVRNSTLPNLLTVPVT